MNLLSKREMDVACLVAEGMTNREISAKLRLSEHTIRNYLFRIFDKIGVSTRVELVLYCLQERPNSSAAGAS
jgi:DNA-binding NarL/FixJ family response regulator